MQWKQKLQQAIKSINEARELVATSKIWAESDDVHTVVLASIDAIDSGLKTSINTARQLIELKDAHD